MNEWVITNFLQPSEFVLQDDVRTSTYKRAIMRNKHLFQGKVNMKLAHFSTVFSRLSWMLDVAPVSCPYLLLKQELPRLSFLVSSCREAWTHEIGRLFYFCH